MEYFGNSVHIILYTKLLKGQAMYTQKDKNSVRYAAALYRTQQKRKSIGAELAIFFGLLVPSFGVLLAFLVSRPV